MQEIFEKIKERLEEEEGLAEADKARCLRKTPTEHAFAKGYATAMHNAIEIVNQVAEEYKHGHFGCNFNGQHEKCKDCGLRGECSHYNTEWFGCSEIPNMSEKVTGSDVPDINVGKNEVEHMLDTIEMRADETWMDYYRKALKGLRELSGKEYNDGWIPCSERLPENKDLCWLTNVWSDGTRHVTYDFYIKGGGWYDTVSDSVLAWMPINKPAPYKPKGWIEWE